MLPNKFWFILAERFQRRRLKCEKLTDHRPSEGQRQCELKSGVLFFKRHPLHPMLNLRP